MTPPQRLTIMLVHDTGEAGGLDQVMRELAGRLLLSADVVLLARGYAEQGWATPATFVDAVRALGVEVLTPVTGRSRFKRVRQAREVASTIALMRRRRPSVVHIHTCSVEGARVQTVAARLAGVPVIRTEHNSPTAYSRKRFDTRARRLADRFTRRVLTVSAHDRSEQLEIVGRPAELVRAIRNGVDTDRFHPPEPSTAAGRTPTAVTIGTLGRLVDQKNHADLVRATHILSAAHPHLRTVIGGDGPLRAELEALVDTLGLDGTVRLPGVTDDPVGFLQALDIGVMTSRHEGLSVALLEMMSCGLPVVVTDHASFREVVDDGITGIVVPTGDTVALAAAIDRLLGDEPLRRRLGDAARRAVVERFSIDAYVAAVLDEYAACVTTR